MISTRPEAQQQKRNALQYHYFPTPLGEMSAASTAGGICVLKLPTSGTRSAFISLLKRLYPDYSLRRVSGGTIRELQDQLQAYFRGGLKRFTVPIDPDGTPFQRMVWDEILNIPYGSTATYGEVAVRVGRTVSSSSAVGGALQANPLAILIPCHRVLGKSGHLVGYSGGLDMKTRLLKLEGALLL